MFPKDVRSGWRHILYIYVVGNIFKRLLSTSRKKPGHVMTE